MTRRKTAGIVRRKLAALLADLGLTVAPDDLWFQDGAHRLCDGARWGTGRATWTTGLAPDGTPTPGEISLHGWETMTECVRNGITITRYDGWRRAEVHANESAPTTEGEPMKTVWVCRWDNPANPERGITVHCDDIGRLDVYVSQLLAGETVKGVFGHYDAWGYVLCGLPDDWTNADLALDLVGHPLHCDGGTLTVTVTEE